jgi:small subunit ribosomal protein S29
VYLPLIEKAVDSNPNITTLLGRLEEISRLGNSLIIPSLKNKLPSPATVLEIAEFAIENSTYATQGLGEIINQLKIQDKFPVLVAVDEWNEMFVVSEYVSTRYDNTIFNGYIPSYHLSVPRLLSRWDGHEFKRGLKLFSTTWSKRNRRQFNPELLGIKPEEMKQVRAFNRDEFSYYCAYQVLTNTSHRFPASKLDYFYMLTQGNGFETRRIMSTLY